LNLTNRILWIDFVKVFAIFAVVILHSAASVVNQFSQIDLVNWNIGNIYDSVVRMSVPLFFMVSGALLLNHKEEPLSQFFSKRFFKVVIPLLGWSLIYIVFRKFALHQDIDLLGHLFQSFYKQQYYHLWFLYTLIGLYLFLPILKIFINSSSLSMQIYFVSIWMIAVSIIPIINKFSILHIPNYMPMMSGYVGFLVLGYLLSKLTISNKAFLISIGFIIVSTFITAFGTYVLSVNAHKFVSFFYRYLSLNTIIQSISFFIFLKYLSEKINPSNISNSIIRQLSLASFGIYLIHPIFLWILKYSVGLYVLNGYHLVYTIPIIAIVTFVLSFIFVYLMQKIPIVKALVP